MRIAEHPKFAIRNSEFDIATGYAIADRESRRPQLEIQSCYWLFLEVEVFVATQLRNTNRGVKSEIRSASV
jgi:hypothetical protein